MSEQIWIADLTEEQLAAWLSAPRQQAPFAVLERIDALDFPAPEEAIDPAGWAQGRIFGAAFELRWERRGEAFHARWTGTGAPGEPFALWQAGLTGAAISETGCYLWGPSEVRIGRRLEYRAVPEGAGRVCLLRREFRRETDGALMAERWAGMEREAEK